MKLANITPIRPLFTLKWLFLFLILLFILFKFVAMPNSIGQLGMWKLMLGVAAAIVGYITSKVLHPEMSITALLAEDHPNELPDAIKLLGILIYRGLTMSAFVVGVLLGV
jgi:hypothetical protein